MKLTTLFRYLVEIADDLIEQSDALQALLVYIVLGVEFFVVGDGGEHDADVVILLRIQLLGSPALQGEGGMLPVCFEMQILGRNANLSKFTVPFTGLLPLFRYVSYTFYINIYKNKAKGQ